LWCLFQCREARVPDKLFLVALILVVERERFGDREIFMKEYVLVMKHATYSCSYSKPDGDYALVAFTSIGCRCAAHEYSSF
jgi:hypothetical protein